jgi:hypothetical protein
VGLELLELSVAAAVRGSRARLTARAARAGVAGCVGITVLDIVMVIGVALAVPSVTWVMVGAMTASAGRIAFSARTLRAVLTS